MCSSSLALMYLHSSVLFNFGTVGLENWEHWDSLHSMLLLDALSLNVKFHGSPWHGLVVALESGIVLITGHKNDLQVLGTIFVYLFVELAKHWSEVSARRAPVRTEINGNELVAIQDFSKWFLSILGKDCIDSWEVGLHLVYLKILVFKLYS